MGVCSSRSKKSDTAENTPEPMKPMEISTKAIEVN